MPPPRCGDPRPRRGVLMLGIPDERGRGAADRGDIGEDERGRSGSRAPRARCARAATALDRDAQPGSAEAIEELFRRHWRRPIGPPTSSSPTRRRRGHRPGVVPGRGPGARPLRPPPPVRALAAPDRRQPGDRLRAAPALRRESALLPPPSPPLRSRRDLGRAARRARRAPARAAGRGRPPLPARVHAGRDRRILGLPRGTVNSRLRRASTVSGRRSRRRARARETEPRRASAHVHDPRGGCGGAALLGDPRRPRRALPAPTGPPARASRPPPRRAVGAGDRAQPGRREDRRLVAEIVGIGAEDANPALRSLPAAGELLVEPAQGLWLVREEGSKRLLGDYHQASWSSLRGLFVAATDGRGPLALDPAGKVRWTFPRRAGP